MTRFEEVGVQRQNECVTKYDAIRQFRNSCHICCNRGIRIECDRCAIAYEHRQVLEAFVILSVPVRVCV